MTVLVLGGEGFLGKRVAANAKQAGHEVVVKSRSTGCDLLQFDSVMSCLKETTPSTIFFCAAHVGGVHYASRHAAEMIHDNAQMALNLYKAISQAAPKAKIINPFSNCTYPGESSEQYELNWLDGPVHDTVLAFAGARRLCYAVSKSYFQQHGIETSNWLVANAYGPGDHHDPDKVHALNGIIIRMLQAQAKGNREFEIWGSGNPIREWIYGDDAARLLVSSIETQSHIEPVNMGQNRGYSIREIAEIVAELIEYPVEFRFNTAMADGAPCKILNDEKFRTLYSDFEFTPLRTGIQATVEYYREALNLPTPGSN